MLRRQIIDLIRPMKTLKYVMTAVLAISFAAAPLSSFAADQKAKAKPYTLKTCIVSDEKLGEMGEAYTFVHEGQEVKLCCKSCLKDFNKNPAKYMKKLAEAEAKAKKKG
jgi:hypothetical protein